MRLVVGEADVMGTEERQRRRVVAVIKRVGRRERVIPDPREERGRKRDQIP